MEVSVDVDHDDEDTKPSGDHQKQQQQLFMTLQHERKMHQEDLQTLNTQINLLQKERELSKAEYLSLSHKLQDQESKNTNVESAPTVNVTDAADMTSTHPANTTLNTTLETMLQKYNELDDDSKKMLTQHALMTDDADLQRRLMELRASQGNNTTLAKLTKEIIKLADTYKVPELKFDEQAYLWILWSHSRILTALGIKHCTYYSALAQMHTFNEL